MINHLLGWCCACHLPSGRANHWFLPKCKADLKANFLSGQADLGSAWVLGRSRLDISGVGWSQYSGVIKLPEPDTMSDSKKTCKSILQWLRVCNSSCFQLFCMNSCMSSISPCLWGVTSAKLVETVMLASCVETHMCLIHEAVMLSARISGAANSSPFYPTSSHIALPVIWSCIHAYYFNSLNYSCKCNWNSLLQQSQANLNL